MIRADRYHRRDCFFAVLLCVFAARAEMTPLSHVDQASGITGHYLLFSSAQPRIKNRCGIHQALCIWVLWMFCNLFHRAEFHKLSEVHDGDLVADIFDHVEIVCDHKISQVQLFL